MTEIGLFPLGLVLLPGERVPLHIFEERYKELIGECLEHSAEFGLVLAEDQELRGVGTRAAVVEVLNSYDDGRLDIVVEGRKPFRLMEMTDGRSFLTAAIDEIPKDEPLIDGGLAERCASAFENLARAALMDPPEIERTESGLAYRIAAHVSLDPELKQELLEMRSEDARLQRLSEILEGLAGVLAYRRHAAERASGNGRVDNF